MRKILAVFNDTHAGHRQGLMNPGVILHQLDEIGNWTPYHPEMTASQEYLWDIYNQDMQRVFELAGGDELLVLHNGDLTQGNKYIHDWVSTRLSDQEIIAAANLEPWFDYPQLRYMRLSIGTAAHNFGEGSSEIMVAQLLRNLHPQTNIQICSHGLLTYNGAVFDYAHHGPGTGLRNWLHGNIARLYLRDLMYREVLRNRVPPDAVLRAHFHTPVYEMLETGEYVSHLFIVPSYCMMDDNAVQFTRSTEDVTHGMLVFEIVDRKIVSFERLYHTLDIRTDEVL